MADASSALISLDKMEPLRVSYLEVLCSSKIINPYDCSFLKN